MSGTVGPQIPPNESFMQGLAPTVSMVMRPSYLARLGTDGVWALNSCFDMKQENSLSLKGFKISTGEHKQVVKRPERKRVVSIKPTLIMRPRIQSS